MFKKTWEKIKVWFNRAWSVFISRATALTGFITAGLAAAEWGPFIGTLTTAGVSRTQALMLGGFLALHGLLSEVARRMNTKTLENGQLVPKNVEVK